MIFPKINKKIGRPRKDLIKIGEYWITEEAISNYWHRFRREYVYSIKCPITNHIVYIGKTDNPEYRKSCHFSLRNKTLVNKWYSAMISIGLTPIFEIIETTYGDSMLIERQYIVYYKSIGQANFNIKIGNMYYFSCNLSIY